MKKFFYISQFLFVMSAFAQTTYLCLLDQSTGFSYDPPSKKWKQTSFEVSSEKYLLTSKDGKRFLFKKFGETDDNLSQICTDPTENGFLFCKGTLGDAFFNNKSLRFQITHAYGYVRGDGDESKSKFHITPYIAIGRCSLI